MHDDGIYFGLPEDEYLADTALGYSDHKRLLFNPARWQFERLVGLREDLGLISANPEVIRAKLDDKAFGSALGKVTLEGLEAFEASYFTPTDPPDELPNTIEQLREAVLPHWQGDMGSRPLARTAARIDYIREARHYGVRTMDDWREEEAQRRDGRLEISRSWAAQLRLIARLLDTPRPDHGDKSIRERVLTDGMPEVSVFWTIETALGPLRLKCRFDWLRPKLVIELKTYTCRDDQETVDAFASTVRKFGYDIQEEHYGEGYQQIAPLVSHGSVHGDHDADWLRRVCAHTGKPGWTWLAVQKVGLPEVDLMEFPLHGTVAMAAHAQVEHARQEYVTYRDKFGEDDLWVNLRGRVQMDDDVFNPGITSRGDKRWTAK